MGYKGGVSVMDNCDHCYCKVEFIDEARHKKCCMCGVRRVETIRFSALSADEKRTLLDWVSDGAV